MPDKPSFAVGQLIEVAAYKGKPRDEMGEVYKVTFAAGWMLHVRLFTEPGTPPKFRNFYQSDLVAA